MRNIRFKYKFLLMILILFTFLLPSNCLALKANTGYVDISNSTFLSVGGLTFEKISFHDNSDSTENFGLHSEVIYNGTKKAKYNSELSYYDSNYNLLMTDYRGFEAENGTNKFNHFCFNRELEPYSINQVKYYVLNIEVLDDENYNTPSKYYAYKSDDYVIDKYNIDMIVNENNTIDITETITAFFNVPKHGIIRTIPLSNKIERLDGTTSKNRTQISNINIDNQYTTSRKMGNLLIKIGSPDKVMTGEQVYTIKYTHNLGKDPLEDKDELYYNIIGNGWDTEIGNISFSITMPKNFDSSKLGFSYGKKGSTGNNKVNYTVNDNKIVGNFDGILDDEEALTVRCELDEGYFVNAKLKVNLLEYIYFIIPIIFLIISYLLWKKYGKEDDIVVDTVEFYPPEGLNSLEVGYFYNGIASQNDVVSLLIYLADKGYIKISESGQKHILSNVSDFQIIKLKDYDGDNLNEQLFLEGLFRKKPKLNLLENKNTISPEDSTVLVTSYDLYDNFYTTLFRIRNNINTKKNRDLIFEKSSESKKIYVIIMILLSYFLITVPAILNYGNIDFLIPGLLFPGIGFGVILYSFFKRSNSGAPFTVKLFLLLWGVFFGGVPWAIMVLTAIIQDPVYLMLYIMVIVVIVGMCSFLNYMPKRTPYGMEMLGKITGFKNFLETAEKEKLEALVEQNPNYFYNILPYAYVLGVSNKWIKNFESISLQAPTWYDSAVPFSISSFSSFMDSTMNSAAQAMSSNPVTDTGGMGGSSGGGFSGGGFSGGGSGGGGGSSW